MKKHKIKSWYCETDNRELIIEIINSFDNINADNIVRQNNNRTVYRIKIDKKYYFVKIIHPALFRHKIRELFYFKKSYSEYKSAEFLERVGLDVVKVEGWGKKGYKSFLVTEDAGLNVINAREFWLQTARKNSYVREEFLSSLSYFLRKCIYANFSHPDFHFGNLLVKVSKDDLKFIFVDPDGIRFRTKKVNLLKQGAGQLLSAIITHELTREESIKLLKDSNIISNEDQYDKLWLALRKYDVKQVNLRWKKRKKKLLSRESRFSEKIVDSENNRWYLRKNDFGESILNKDLLDIALLSKKHSTEILPFKEAKHKLLLSFYMQFNGIPHVLPIAMYVEYNKQESILIYENYDHNEHEKISEDIIEHMKKLCETCDVVVNSYENSIVYKGNKPILKEYNYIRKL